ncbi:methyl-accepting chemotaxis protein [Novosphingobium sp. KA1]|uniref:methyl-accepting chemotaxis protein n=1 Tax=Novosphingobium sp. (strain KA1) TaxID=164608 RepID=UPI001A8E7515|nr:cache domain-containing protein [Novosphingobium sp. KA1]QSR19807.1 hypothetical protein CA833_21930 [Novosphingobium sp. KA1]
MTSLRTFLARQHLSTKVTLMTVSALALLAGTLFISTRVMLMSSAREQGATQLDTNMRVAWSVLETQGKGYSLRDGVLHVGNTRLDGDDAAVDRIKALVGGNATIFSGATRVATNIKKDDGTRAVGTPLDPGPARDAVLGKGQPYRGETRILNKPYFAAYDPIRDDSGKVIGILYVGVPKDSFYAHVTRLGWQILIIALVLTALCAAVCMRAARRLFQPLQSATETMASLSQGHNHIEIADTARPDEIGDIARALLVFRDAAITKEEADRQQRDVVETLAARLEQLSSGDLTAAIERAFPGSYEELRLNYNSALSGLRELIGATTASTHAIRGGSSEIAQASEDLARRTEANAANLEQSSAALVEIDQRLRTGTASATATVARADQAMTTVDEGRTIAARAVDAMRQVADSTRDIDNVIEGLDKIAFQTRVLAMNAAVEAGQAGDAGRGFAVVADLVSALAIRSEEEARSAREQLTLTRTGILTAVGAVEQVDEAFTGIAQDMGQVHALLGGVAGDNAAASETVSEITTAIGAMNLATQQNAAMVEQTSAAARSLTSEVDRLAAQASTFKVA